MTGDCSNRITAMLEYIKSAVLPLYNIASAQMIKMPKIRHERRFACKFGSLESRLTNEMAVTHVQHALEVPHFKLCSGI